MGLTPISPPPFLREKINLIFALEKAPQTLTVRFPANIVLSWI